MIFYYRTEGFVFKKEDRLEADRVFSVFTKDFGRIEVFGKAIRKINAKLRSGIEIFSLSEIEFIQGKNKKTLIYALLLEKFKNIENVPEKLEIAYKISDVLDSLIKGEEKDENIFNLLNDSLSKLNNYSPLIADYLLIYYYFFWNFISILGHKPEIFKCVACQQKLNPESLYFSNKEGGVICKVCFSSKKDGVKTNSDLVKVLRLILKKVPRSGNGTGIPVAEGDLGNWDILPRLKIENKTKLLLKEISESYHRYLLSI